MLEQTIAVAKQNAGGSKKADSRTYSKALWDMIPKDYAYSYFFPAEGECLKGDALGTDGCTWRVKKFYKGISTNCMTQHIIGSMSKRADFNSLVDKCMGGDRTLLNAIPPYRQGQWPSTDALPVTKRWCQLNTAWYLMEFSPDTPGAERIQFIQDTWRSGFESCPAVATSGEAILHSQNQ